jgi:phosphinothricin acetyltransferase
MSIEIKSYKPADCEAILEIINYNIEHATALYDYHPRTLAEQLAVFEDKIQKNFPIIVAYEKEQIVGFGYYSEFRFKDGYKFTVEHSVYVNKDFQGKKIGNLLLAQLIELAKKQKLHTMIAVIDSENLGSVKFHENFGFKTVGVLKETGYKFDKWLDSVFMQLFLK